VRFYVRFVDLLFGDTVLLALGPKIAALEVAAVARPGEFLVPLEPTRATYELHAYIRGDAQFLAPGERPHVREALKNRQGLALDVGQRHALDVV
jgi:hypothetical protein